MDRVRHVRGVWRGVRRGDRVGWGMSSAAHIFIDSIAFGVFTGICLFAYALYLVADSFYQRVVWEDRATRRGKAEVVLKETARKANWKKAPRTFFNGFMLGFVASLIVEIFWNGLKVTFL